MNILDAKNIIVYYDGTTKAPLAFELTKLFPQIKPTHLLNKSGKSVPNITLSKVDSIDDIPNMEMPFVLLAISITNDSEQNKAKEIVNKLIEKGISYDYMPNLFKKQITTSRIMKTLGFLDYINPITKNEIHLTATSGSLFQFNFFENSNYSKVIIEKNSYACDDLIQINIFGTQNKVNIKNNVFIFKGSQIEACGNSEIIINNETNIENNCKITCGHKYTRIDGETNDVLSENNQIIIGKHVKIEEDSKICTGAKIGDGCVVSTSSVVYGEFENCCLLAGNPASISKKNVSWANERVPNYSPNELFYNIKDRSAFKYFENREKATLYGICVMSRINEFLKKLKSVDIIFQNPIHTMFANPIFVEENNIITSNNSAFIIKNLHSEFNKTIAQRINNGSKYFIFDIADFRWNYFEFTKPAGAKVYKHYNSVSTINNINTITNNSLEYTSKNFNDIFQSMNGMKLLINLLQ